MGIIGSVPPGYTRVGLVVKHVMGKEIRITASEDRTCSQLTIYPREENCHLGLQLQLLFCGQGGCELPGWVPGAAQPPRGTSSRPMLGTAGDLAFLTAPYLELGVFSYLGFSGTVPLLCDFQRLQRDSSITSARSSRSQAV